MLLDGRHFGREKEEEREGERKTESRKITYTVAIRYPSLRTAFEKRRPVLGKLVFGAQQRRKMVPFPRCLSSPPTWRARGGGNDFTTPVAYAPRGLCQPTVLISPAEEPPARSLLHLRYRTCKLPLLYLSWPEGASSEPNSSARCSSRLHHRQYLSFIVSRCVPSSKYILYLW